MKQFCKFFLAMQIMAAVGMLYFFVKFGDNLLNIRTKATKTYHKENPFSI
jgi:hypothetical protein